MRIFQGGSRKWTSTHGQWESANPHADAPPHALDECLLEEVGESVGCVLPALCLLQFLPDSPDVAGDACDGIQPHRSRLDNCRITGVINSNRKWGVRSDATRISLKGFRGHSNLKGRVCPNASPVVYQRIHVA